MQPELLDVVEFLLIFPTFSCRLATRVLPNAPYCLMAFPDTVYLWADAEVKLEQSEPTYIIDAQPILSERGKSWV
jgi:hypothetical protein